MNTTTTIEKMIDSIAAVCIDLGLRGGYTPEEITDLVCDIAFAHMYDALRDRAETVYAYSTDGDRSMTLKYRSRKLFDREAIMKSRRFTPNGWIPMPSVSRGMPRQGLLWNPSLSRQSRRTPKSLPENGKRKGWNLLQRNPGRMIVSFSLQDIPPAVRPMVLPGRKWGWSLGRVYLNK